MTLPDAISGTETRLRAAERAAADAVFEMTAIREAAKRAGRSELTPEETRQVAEAVGAKRRAGDLAADLSMVLEELRAAEQEEREVQTKLRDTHPTGAAAPARDGTERPGGPGGGTRTGE